MMTSAWVWMWPKEGKRWRVMIHFSWLEVESLRRKVTVLCARLPCFMQAKIVIFSESEQRKSFHWQDVKLSRFGIVLNCQGYNWNHNSYLLILSVLLSAKVKNLQRQQWFIWMLLSCPLIGPLTLLYYPCHTDMCLFISLTANPFTNSGGSMSGHAFHVWQTW